MAKETSAPSATISDTTEKTALSTDALTVASCDLDMTKTGISISPSESPHQKLSKTHTSPPIDKVATPLPHLMESKREGTKGRNPNGRDSKIPLIEVFPDNSGKWMKNTTKNSRISLSLLTTRSNTTTLHTTTSMES